MTNDEDTSGTGHDETDGYNIFISGTHVPQGYIDTITSTQWENREWNKRYYRKFRHTCYTGATVKFRV